MAREQSSIGSAIHYGPRSTEKIGVSLDTDTLEEVLVYDFDYANLPSADENDEAVPTIPAGSTVIDARIEVLTAFSGDSVDHLDIGLAQEDGTAIDADGLVDGSADGVVTSTGFVKGAGALIDASVGSDPAQVTAAALKADGTTPSTPTAGVARLIVKYIQAGS